MKGMASALRRRATGNTRSSCNEMSKTAPWTRALLRIIVIGPATGATGPTTREPEDAKVSSRLCATHELSTGAMPIPGRAGSRGLPRRNLNRDFNIFNLASHGRLDRLDPSIYLGDRRHAIEAHRDLDEDQLARAPRPKSHDLAAR